jgi:hypothetical protein
MIYLASPYSHRHAMIREQRYHDACLAAAQLLRSGQNVFSPIVHGHPLVAHGLPTEWSYWEAFDRDHIRRCDQLAVLTIDGWQDSISVTAEMELGKVVSFVDLAGTPTLAHVEAERRS